MTSRFLPYLRLQFTRMRRFLPVILGISLLLLFSVGLYALGASLSYRNDEDRMQVEIGVVGDTTDPYIQTVLFTINNLDDAGISMHMTQMTREQARTRLLAGELHSYVIFPENFSDRYYAREPVALTYVASPTSSAMGNVLSDEIAHVIGALFGDGQDAMFGIKSYVKSLTPKRSVTPYSQQIREEFTRVIFSRSDLFRVEETGLFLGQGFTGYVGISLTVFFVLVWGVCFAPLFSRKNGEANRLLRSAGLGAAGQVAGEFLPYAVLSVSGLLIIALLAGIGLHSAVPGVLDALFDTASGAVRFMLRLALVTLTFSGMHFMLYRLARGTVPALLLQTLTAVAMGYVSGCFYSKDFFPPVLAEIGRWMPSSFGIRYLSGRHPEDLWALLGFFVFCMAVCLIKRRTEMAGDSL